MTTDSVERSEAPAATPPLRGWSPLWSAAAIAAALVLAACGESNSNAGPFPDVGAIDGGGSSAPNDASGPTSDGAPAPSGDAGGPAQTGQPENDGAGPGGGDANGAGPVLDATAAGVSVADGGDAGTFSDAATDGNGTTDAASHPVQIMPLGDSITYGADGTNAGYRGPLYNLLKTPASNVLYVGSSVEGIVTTTISPLPLDQRHNEGHGSYTINEINNNLDGLDSTTFNRVGGANRDPNGGHWLDGIASGAHMRPALYPDIITLMIGTNNAADTDRVAVRTQLHALLTKITTMRPDTKLIVAQITPSNRPNNVTYNAAVASEVASFQAAGKHISLVDMYTSFPSAGLYSDGVHPNDQGYAFMAQQWRDAILAVMPHL